MLHLAVRRVCLWGLFAALAACGGGGGDEGGSGSSTGLTLRNVRATGTTQQVYASTAPIGDVTILGDVTGDLSRLSGRTVYVIVIDPDGLFEGTPSVSIMSNGLDNSVHLFGKATQGRSGTFRGPLTLRLCLDSTCTQEFDGSPVQLPLQIEVLAGLQVGPASPLVIDLPFGQMPTAIDVPVTLPIHAPGFSATLTPLPGRIEPAFDYERLPAPAQGLRILPRRLPVGTYTQTFTLDASAILGMQAFPLQATLPVTINVRPTPGLAVAIDPPQVALQTLTTGSFIPEASVPLITVLAADGQRYSALSRVVYLPAGPGGLLDAGGIPWLEVGVGLAPRDWDSIYSTLALACNTPTVQCLAPGRYAANVYFRIPGGAEWPTPLPVTVDVR